MPLLLVQVHSPFATGIASGFAGTIISEGLIGRVVNLIGVNGRLSEKIPVDTFIDGARDMLGVARGVTVIMNNGLITGTVSNKI